MPPVMRKNTATIIITKKITILSKVIIEITDSIAIATPMDISAAIIIPFYIHLP